MTSVPERPRLDARFVFRVEPGGVLVLEERGHARLPGRLFAELLPRLTGEHSAGEIARAMVETGAFEAAEIFAALVLLAEAGYLAPEDGDFVPRPNGEKLLEADGPFFAFEDTAKGISSSARQRIHLVEVGCADRRILELARELDGEPSLGLPTGDDDVDLVLVIGDDLLAPSLGDIERRLAVLDVPWLLVQPFGLRPSIGPLFRVKRATGGASRPLEWQDLVAARKPHLAAERSSDLRPPRPASRESLAWVLKRAMERASAFLKQGSMDEHGALLEDHVFQVDFESSEIGWHRVRALDPPRSASRIELEPRPKVVGAPGGSRTLPVERTLHLLRRSVSPLTGPVRKVERVSGDPPPRADLAEEPPWTLPMEIITTAHGLPGTYGDWSRLERRLESRCAGKGRNPVQAEVSALAEALERYAGFYREGDAMKRASWIELVADIGDAAEGGGACHPNSFLLFSERQYRRRKEANALHGGVHWIPLPLDGAAPVDWTSLYSLRDGACRFLPSDYLYYDVPNPSPFFRADSNGCAAGTCLEEAILQGLLELIERDGVAIWWYSKARRPPLPWPDHTFAGEIRRAFEQRGRDLWLLDVTSDLGVPVVAAISRHSGRRANDTLIGFGAHLEEAVAIERALSELCQFLTKKSAPERRLIEHPEGTLDWLEAEISAPRSPRRDLANRDLAKEVEALVDLMAANGHDTLVLDQSRPDVPLRVVKVVVPGLRPWWARLAPGRLYDVPVRLGWRREPLPENSLNSIPLHL